MVLTTSLNDSSMAHSAFSNLYSSTHLNLITSSYGIISFTSHFTDGKTTSQTPRRPEKTRETSVKPSKKSFIKEGRELEKVLRGKTGVKEVICVFGRLNSLGFFSLKRWREKWVMLRGYKIMKSKESINPGLFIK